MTAITLTKEEFEKMVFLLRDINTIQKLNKVFDTEAIHIFENKILDHLNVDDILFQKLIKWR